MDNRNKVRQLITVLITSLYIAQLYIIYFSRRSTSNANVCWIDRTTTSYDDKFKKKLLHIVH